MSSLGKFRKLVYIPFILMIVSIAYAVPALFDFDSRSLIEPHTDEYGTPVSADSPKIISESLTSPNNVYAVKEDRNSFYVIFEVYDKEGNMIARKEYEDRRNVDLYGEDIKSYGQTLGCQCKISFKGWINNYTFAIRTLKEDGAEYEDIVDIRKLL